MNIIIFGANGKIGKRVLIQALNNGDSIKAYVRNSDVHLNTGNIRIVIGDLQNSRLIEKELFDVDIVVSTVGPPLDLSRKIKGTPIADGHEVIINTMKKLGKKRFITIGTPTIRADEDDSYMSNRIPPFLAKILFPNPFREMKKLEQLIKNSDLDWTIVRYINPNAKNIAREYSISLGDKPAKFSVSRDNVALLIYKVALGNLYIRQMPIVFNV